MIWGALSTPPKTATLAMPNGAPSFESVSCVWSASSRVGAITSVSTVEIFDFGLCSLDLELGSSGDKVSIRDRAGIPNASVLPLPVSAIPITS